MRWLVAGAGGMLGVDLVQLLRARGHDVTAAARADLDVRDAAACLAAVEGHDIVVNCAAFTAVDRAEEEQGAAFDINAVGAANLAVASARVGAAVVQVSTDYVFAGDAREPYAADAPIAPRTVYGRTKAAGEWAVRAATERAWVVRTSWLYGAGGPSFPAMMARLAGERENVSVVTDETGSPTWTVDVADAIERIVSSGAAYGTWHATSSGACSWFDLARACFEELGLDPGRVHPTTAAEFARPAPRPSYSVLSHAMWGRSGLAEPRPWREALAAAADTVLRKRPPGSTAPSR